MKNLLYIFTASVLLVQGCSDRAYVGGLEDENGASCILPVKVSVGSPSAKGGYAVDGVDDMRGKDIHVYAFRKSDKASYKVMSAADPAECLVDASSDGNPEDAGGKVARLSGTSFYADWVGKRVNWPTGDNHKDTYDFFAYYADDAELSEVIREDDRVVVGLTIDGSQDIMLSKASLTASQLSGLNDDDKEKALFWSYSQFTAFRNISPVFTFSHQLVNLDFETAAGIESVAVLSNKKALLTVAHKTESELGISFIDNVAPMAGKEALEYALKVEGNSVLVAPAAKYMAYVTLNGASDPVVVEISMDGKRFLAGKSYTVRLTADASAPWSVHAETELK